MTPFPHCIARGHARSPWDHGQPQEGKIPTVLVLPDHCFSGLDIADIPFRCGSNILFILKGTLGKYRAQISLFGSQ